MEWIYLPLIPVGFGFAMFVASGMPVTISKQRNNARIEVQRLKTEEARELRLKAEIEHGFSPSERTYTEM